MLAGDRETPAVESRSGTRLAANYAQNMLPLWVRASPMAYEDKEPRLSGWVIAHVAGSEGAGGLMLIHDEATNKLARVRTEFVVEHRVTLPDGTVVRGDGYPQ